MLAATSDKKASEIGVKMCLKLVEWGQGAVEDDWFREALRSRPVTPNFHIPHRSQWLRGFDRAKRSVIALLALASLIAPLVKSGKELSKI